LRNKRKAFVLFYLILFIPIMVMTIYMLKLNIIEAKRAASVNKINVVNNIFIKDIQKVFVDKVSKLLIKNPELIKKYLDMPIIIKETKYPTKIKISQYQQGLILGNLNLKTIQDLLNKIINKYQIEYHDKLMRSLMAVITNYYNNKLFYKKVDEAIEQYIKETGDEVKALTLKRDIEKLFSIKYNGEKFQAFKTTNSLILSVILQRPQQEIKTMKGEKYIFSLEDKKLLEKYKIKTDIQSSYLYKFFFIIEYKEIGAEVTNKLLYNLKRGLFIGKYNIKKFHFYK